MTGFIHGEVNWTDPSAEILANVQRMSAAVAHYPWAATTIEDPDAPSERCVLGVQRRRDGGARPHSQRDLTMRIAADLQLHALAALTSELGLSAAEAADLGDDQLALIAFRRWGTAAAQRLVGEGALAIWDAAAERLICWRDPAGVRPLYYWHVPGRRLVFSSDLQSLAAHPELPLNLDVAYVRAFLDMELFPHQSRTFIDGVGKLPSAHLLMFDRQGLILRRYWNPEDVPERSVAHDDECVEELRTLLRQSISDRIPPAGTGVGAHLSGGLDSSSIALTAPALLGERQLSTFSWSPPKDVVGDVELDERDLIDAVDRHAGTRTEYTLLEPRDIADFGYRDVPLRPRVTLSFELATSRQAVASGVGTMLSGWGGDETIAFNGRGHFADLARRGQLATVQRELKLRSDIHGGTLRGAWKHRVLWPLLPERVASRGRRSTPGPLPQHLRPDFAHLLQNVEPVPAFPIREVPGVHRMQAALLRLGHLQTRMEAWAAHGASIGLAYTFPLLDKRMMEFALSLPGRMFFRDGWKRWLYRTAMAGILPDAVRWNPSKYDNAATRQLHIVPLEPSPVYRARLEERRDSPLIDVDALLADQDRRGEAGGSPISPGSWLAFTTVLPA